LVISSFSAVYEQSNGRVPPLQLLQAGVTASLHAMRLRASQDVSLVKMGSTVVAAVLKGRNIFLINVGDSRAYLVHERQIRQISYDHSLVGEQLRQGIITEEDVRRHPRRNVLSMSISAQREEITTYTCASEWQPGDVLVLCSDGLWGPVTEPQIQAMVLEYRPQQAADRLVFQANANQGPDNISVIVARYS
jgi:protein phosphatase